MSLETILKEIYKILDILQTARSDKVKDWDSQMVDNAIKWAAYGEKMYERANGKPYQKDLDDQIKHFGHLPWSLGDIEVNLELLRNAESLMKETLLQNQWLNDTTYDYVLSLYQLGSESGIKSLLEVCQKLNQEKSSADLLEKLWSSLTGNTDDSQLSEVTNEAQARLLVSFVTRSLAKTPQQKKDRTLNHLRKIIAEFAKKTGSMDVLAVALKGQFPDILTDPETENCTKTVILHAVMSLSQQHREALKKLLQPAGVES